MEIFALYYLVAGFYQIDQILGWLWSLAAASVPAVALDSAIWLPNAYLPLCAQNFFFIFIVHSYLNYSQKQRNGRRERAESFILGLCVCVCVRALILLLMCSNKTFVVLVDKLFFCFYI